MTGIDKAYLADLQRLLEAEAEMRRNGVDLLADAEYSALREQFIDGAMSLPQLAERIEALSGTRADDDGHDDDDPDDDGPDDGDPQGNGPGDAAGAPPRRH